VDAHISGWRHPRDITCVQLQPPIAIPFPLGADRWRIYFLTDSPNAEILRNLGTRLTLLSPGAVLREPEEPKCFQGHSRVARRFRAGRVLIAGDAAHVSNPIEGHGMNGGIQDVHNLGWKLALAASGQGTEALLDSYEAERRPIAQAIIRSGDDAEARLVASGSAARRELIEFLSTAEGQTLAALAESELAFGYEESPIVTESGTGQQQTGGGTKVGCRVGDFDGLVGRDAIHRLHELIAVPDHTLFLLAGAGDRPEVDPFSLLKAIMERHPGRQRAYVVSRNAPGPGPLPEHFLVDQTGRLHERLAGACQRRLAKSATGPTLCLIRPDGHLGFRCHPPSLDAIDTYFQRLFAHVNR
jgi:hypothetical protein